MATGKLADKKVMITGATGFLGSNLAIALAKHGCQVQALVRSKKRARPLQKAGIDLFEGDLVHAKDVLNAARGAQIIFHIAALYRPAKYPDRIYRKVNVEGTRNIIRAARTCGVQRLVHCSTVGVHGDVKSIPANEHSPFAPGDIYQKTKLEGEMLVQKAISDGLPATVFRPVGIYGPGDLRFSKLFKIIYQGRFRMLGSGKAFYHLVYIDDLVRGAILCAVKPQAVGQTYILAGPQYTTIAQLTDSIADAFNKRHPVGHLPLLPVKISAAVCEKVFRSFGREPPLYRRRLDFFWKNRAFSIDRAAQELGYSPQISLPQGLQRTAAWYLDQGILNGRRPERTYVGLDVN